MRTEAMVGGRVRTCRRDGRGYRPSPCGNRKVKDLTGKGHGMIEADGLLQAAWPEGGEDVPVEPPSTGAQPCALRACRVSTLVPARPGALPTD